MANAYQPVYTPRPASDARQEHELEADRQARVLIPIAAVCTALILIIPVAIFNYLPGDKQKLKQAIETAEALTLENTELRKEIASQKDLLAQQDQTIQQIGAENAQLIEQINAVKSALKEDQ